MKVLTNNWQLKLMALGLAAVLWSHVRGEVNPWEEATFKIPLELRPPEKMVVTNVEQLPRTVKVAVRAPRLTLRQLKGVAPPNPFAPLEEAPLLKDKTIRAEVELASAGAGRQKATINAATQLDDVQIVGVNPDSVIVALDKAVGAEFAVEARLDADNLNDYELQSVRLEPSRAQVSGLSADVAQVAGVRARITPEELKLNSSKTVRATLVAVDKRGAEIDNLRVQPSFVEIKATLREKQATRSVPIAARPTGILAAGWRLNYVRVTPATLRVRGPKSVLEKLDKLVAPIDIDGESGALRRRVAVKLPPDVSALETARVSVEVSFRRVAATPIVPITPRPSPTSRATVVPSPQP